MAWDIAVIALMGFGSFVLAYIGVEFCKFAIIKEEGKKMVWLLFGALFIGGSLGLIYGGFAFGLQVIDSQDPTSEDLLTGLLTATYSFYGWFITGLISFIFVIIFWYLLEKIINIIRRPIKSPEELLNEDEES